MKVKLNKQVLEDYNNNKYHTAKSIVVKSYERSKSKTNISEYLSSYKSIKSIKREPPFYEDLDAFKNYFSYIKKHTKNKRSKSQENKKVEDTRYYLSLLKEYMETKNEQTDFNTKKQIVDSIK